MSRELEDQLEKRGVMAVSYSAKRMLIVGSYSYNAVTGAFRYEHETLGVIKEGSPGEIADAISRLINERREKGYDR